MKSRMEVDCYMTCGKMILEKAIRVWIEGHLLRDCVGMKLAVQGRKNMYAPRSRTALFWTLGRN